MVAPRPSFRQPALKSVRYMAVRVYGIHDERLFMGQAPNSSQGSSIAPNVPRLIERFRAAICSLLFIVNKKKTGTPACPFFSLCSLCSLWLIFFDFIGVYLRLSAAPFTAAGGRDSGFTHHPSLITHHRL